MGAYIDIKKSSNYYLVTISFLFSYQSLIHNMLGSQQPMA